MSLTVAVQMDPIERINIVGDSTFALMLEAQKRGHTLFFYTPDSLAMQNGKVTASLRPCEVRDEVGNHVTLGEKSRIDLGTMDVVLLRQDPPFDMNYITTTHFLERIHPKTLVVNDPAHVRNAPEKVFVTEFAELMPPTLITRDIAEIEAFRREHGEVVMKPLYGNGGEAIFKVNRQDPNFSSMVEMFTKLSREPWVTQKFLPEVALGDKRVILMDGAFAGAINRVPKEGEIRSNLVRGGGAQSTDITPREREICEAIGPELKRRGLIFVGIDVIAGNMTEINVTSPTGIRAIKRAGGPDLAEVFWNCVESKI
ncbi:MAG: glutathione synthase [Beijerinckiaceae bacterium]|nr:glutathione synthase [Beijerinckiaceae bacterium]